MQVLLDIFRGDKTEELWGAASPADVTLATLLLATASRAAVFIRSSAWRRRSVLA